MEFAQFTDEWVEGQQSTPPIAAARQTHRPSNCMHPSLTRRLPCPPPCADSVLMAALSDSGCDCCSMTALPLCLPSLIDACTDIDTDGREADSLPSSSPWPLHMREAVWKDRLLFRQLLKARTPQLIAASTANPVFLPFLSSLSSPTLVSLFTFTIPQLHLHLRASFPFSPPFLSLLHSLLTQLQHFTRTHYPPALDACTRAELGFAEALRGEEGEGAGRLVVEEGWLREGLEGRLKELGGKLLVRRRKEEGAGAGAESKARVGERFRNDRRLLRLCIFRLGVERAVDLFAHTPHRAPATGEAQTK